MAHLAHGGTHPVTHSDTVGTMAAVPTSSFQRLSCALTLTCAFACSSDAPASDAVAASVVVAPGDASVVVVPSEVTVDLVPQETVTGTQVVNFALPLSPGALSDATQVEVFAAETALAAHRHALARYSDGSIRSVQLQVEVDVDATTALRIELGAESTGGERTAIEVVDTLLDPSGESGPRVWVQIPPEWLSAAQLAGPSLPHSAFDGTALDAWQGVCDYDRWDTDAFLEVRGDRGPWLYDRVTTLVRGYQIYGGQSPLSSAFREAHIYRNGITGTGADTRIGVPSAASDVKYHYVQGLALHYLLTGDERFREASEHVADRMAALWPSPEYAGGSDFWTERHAGFSLLAYVWAAAVSDDRANDFTSLADDAVDAYISVQETYPLGYDDDDARCFSHEADAHGEGYGYMGCSPWMSAILADGLDAYADLRGGSEAITARQSLVKLGRAIAEQGLDGTGKPYYWMGMGSESNEVDSYDEHWGEPAYVVALAYHHDGRSDSELFAAATELTSNLASSGSSPHIRSFNWQCRSAVTTPFLLAP